MKNVVVTISLFFCMLIANAQNKRLWGGVEVGYGYTLAKKESVNGISYPNTNTFSSIQAVLGYYAIEDKFSIGIGSGLYGYSNPGLNILPLFLNLRLHPFHDRNIILGSNLGYSLLTNEDIFKAGFLMDAFVGYKVCNIKKVSIIPSLGYNFCQYSVKGTDGIKHNNNRNSVFIKLGLAF